MAETLVTRKGQITIPAALRKKYRLTEGTRVQVEELQGTIVLKRGLSIFDLAGHGAGKADVAAVKRKLDKMRREDA